MMRSTSSSGVLALILVVAAAIVNHSSAFSLHQQRQQPKQETKLSSSRRAFFGKSSEFAKYAAVTLAGSGVVLQRPESANAALKTGAANPFTGDYDDPNHPGCKDT